MDELNVVLPIAASIITVLLTKAFDYAIAKRKEPLDKFTKTTEAVDEIAGASTETIAYLRIELERLKEKCIEAQAESLVKDRIILNLSRKLADMNGNSKVKETK
jgi:hypothetical protein